MTYQAPISDITHILTHIADIDEFLKNGYAPNLDHDLLSAILEEAGKFAGNQLAPLNKIGDQQGCSLSNGDVKTPDGWVEAYKEWSEAGWASLASDEQYGGQALPHILAQSVGEFWNSANMAFGLCPLLTQGAVDAIAHHASDELKNVYLEKMISGQWTGTMNLTEPQAGSDLAAIKTKAVPKGDGTYAIKGTKIFITYGEHDLTENIIHLVLARLPDAPEGTKGISLFIVPKFLPDENGNPGQRNDLLCTGLEHKLGIHASPTSVMSFGEKDGAIGYLVGEENRGLFAMFTMMNLARLSVGTQGVAIMERSYQQALNYARERLQGAAIGSPKGTMDPIISHPDIRRNLGQMKAMTMAARAICLITAKHMDISLNATDETDRSTAKNIAALLTPIAKAFSTDLGVEATSIGIQIHGGMGFIEETGAAQHLRDARILPIYEGTNGIQAIDLMFRKLPLEGGNTVNSCLGDLKTIAENLKKSPDIASQMGPYLKTAIDDLEASLSHLQSIPTNDPAPLYYAATPLLRLFGISLGGAYLIKGAIAASSADSPYHLQQTAIAALFSHQFLSQTDGLKNQIISGATTLEQQTEKLFS